MSDPWFQNPTLFGALYGGIVGGLGGALAGVLGALAGVYAPRGIGRRWVLGAMKGMLAFGVLNLALGIVAVAAHQPYAIWYPFAICGVILTVVLAAVIPSVRRRYDEAEERRMQAEDLRNT